MALEPITNLPSHLEPEPSHPRISPLFDPAFSVLLGRVDCELCPAPQPAAQLVSRFAGICSQRGVGERRRHVVWADRSGFCRRNGGKYMREWVVELETVCKLHGDEFGEQRGDSPPNECVIE